MDPYSETSELVKISRFDTQGLGVNHQSRRHKSDHLADAGSHKARSDWLKDIGSLREFGGYNHISRNFSALVLPLYRPDRLELLAHVPESQAEAGLRLMYEVCISQSLQADEVCAKRVTKAWKTAIDTTVREESVEFQSIEDHLEFRMIHTGAPFVEALMLSGMGITLTPQEDPQLARIIQPCFAALALTND
ncbi:terpenoid synthase [Fusarium sporotrichioides]|uniref:Terpenoid synthase n=1 Tax=Fusarium sporotrichioides TaxID=5514 RepID=A0A395SJ60_FUSSP|nr:terpenoid synthase [Fusarium sporotrichioides]